MNAKGKRPPKDGAKPDKPEFDDPSRIGGLKEQMYSRGTQPMSRPRRPLSGMEKVISDNWEEQAPPPKKEPRLPRSYSLPSILLIVSIFVFVIAGGVAVSFFISGINVVTSSKIDIAINGPRTIGGGEILEFQVAVRNNNNATLELADLVVTYPKGTRAPSNISVSMESQRISLDSIEPGGTRSITIRGVLFGRDSEKQDIKVVLEYRLKGSSALFFSEKTYTVLMNSGTLDISITTNKQAVAGQSIDMIATITSQAKVTIADVVLRVSYPFGFTITNASPKTESNGLWSLGDMKPGETRTVRILGTLDGQTTDTRIFKFVAGTRKTPRASEVDVVLADFEQEIVITRPFLGMSLSYNERLESEYIARTGKTVPIKVRWRNNLDVALTNVVVVATISGSAFDKFNISANRGFYRSLDSVVLWDKTTTKGDLELIPAGEDGTLTIRLKPKKSEDLFNVQDPTIKIELHAVGQRLSEGSVPETIQATVSEEIKVATDIGFTGKALYFENPLGSVGPLPPKVEYETTYGIKWEVSNTTNLVRDAKITATLPRYVRWLGTVSPAVENVTFNENNKTITWRIGKLLPNTGVGGRQSRRVVFSVGLVPSTSQIGKKPSLIQNQKLIGVDNFVDRPVEAKLKDLTTGLNEKDFARSYGAVIPK